MKRDELNRQDPGERSPFSPTEWRAIEEHRRKLSERAGREVPVEEVIGDWLKNCSRSWREEYMKKASQAQLQEMLKHKWIESEKAGHDLGTMAIEDWIKKYARLWRKWWEEREK